MSEWQEVTLGEIFKVKHGFAFKGEYFTEKPQSTVLVTPGNFAIGGGFQDGKRKYYNGPVPEDYVLSPGQVVVTMTDLSKESDTLGYAASIPNDANTWLHNQRVGLLEFKPAVPVAPRFIQYLLRTHEYRSWVVGSATGTTVKHTSPGRIESFKTSLPPIGVQRAIAHILGTLDDKIELNCRMNETLEAMARAIFQSWFVDFDPVRAKASGESADAICQRLGLTPELLALFPDSFEDSELGDIPQGWVVTTLQSMTSKIGSGATPRGGREVYVDEGAALIRSQNVYDSQFVWEGLARITDEAAKQLSGVEVKLGDVLINITGASILRTCVVEPEVLPARVNQHVAIIRAKAKSASRYIHLHLMSADMKAYLMGLNAGASREAVTKGHLESVPIINPGKSLLEQFSETVTSLYAKVEQLAKQGRTLQNLRDALLPKLLSGEIGTDELLIR